MTHTHDDFAIRTAALEAVLVEKDLVSIDAIDAIVDVYENDVGPQNGARVVARAWTDPDYRERLLQAGTAAIAGLRGFEGDTMVVLPPLARGARARRRRRRPPRRR